MNVYCVKKTFYLGHFFIGIIVRNVYDAHSGDSPRGEPIMVRYLPLVESDREKRNETSRNETTKRYG